MPYENLGIIKVPERIARFSACIAVCIYRVCMYSTGMGPKTDCSTVLGLFTSRSEGEVNVITTDVGVKYGGRSISLLTSAQRRIHKCVLEFIYE